MSRELKVDVSISQVYRAKRKAREMMEGNIKLQHSKLWDYCVMIKETTPGSITLMKLESRYYSIEVTILKDFVPRYHFKGEEYKEALYRAASVGSIKEWEKAMLHLKSLDKDDAAHAWLSRLKPSTWARDLPILSMLDWIRRKLMKRFYAKSVGMKSYNRLICPDIQEKLEKLKQDSFSCFSTPAGRMKYEVECGTTSHVVNLAEKTCTCRRWDITGQHEWVASNKPLAPPIIYKSPGRPKKGKPHNKRRIRLKGFRKVAQSKGRLEVEVKVLKENLLVELEEGLLELLELRCKHLLRQNFGSGNVGQVAVEITGRGRGNAKAKVSPNRGKGRATATTSVDVISSQVTNLQGSQTNSNQ
ncbi:hypothetical protein COLO4_14042 [Corchorus olitorius]|uniref:Uncharacterized protein n=1 Tax=Corchorus olitorius TaxID=93759 RepID=A0A1R3JTV0_9ROSI|nr:hypothetical protein COLO4_14042 [Corchorus olitorius]